MGRVFDSVKAICYSGYRDGQSPETKCPSKEEVREDLLILSKEGYKYIRMYDPNDHARFALEVIREENLDIKCMIGVDSLCEVNNPDSATGPQNFSREELEANIERNNKEFEKLVALCKEFIDEIIAVSVGNENTPVWATRRVTEDRLIEHADYLKKELNKPVVFCEIVDEWGNLSKLVEHLDVICIHSYPLHNSILIDDAVSYNEKQYKLVSDMYPNKEVIFTEVGWTTKPSSHMVPGQATVSNQKTYINALNSWLDESKITGFIFEAFDESWKAATPDKGECNWGLYRMDRTRKW